MKNKTAATNATAGATAATTTPAVRQTATQKYVNNTCRQRLWVCACVTHVVDAERVNDNRAGGIRQGPYKIRVAGDGLLALCQYCQTMFRLEDKEATRTRAYKGCAHCSNPEEHDHGTAFSMAPLPSESMEADGL